MKIVFICGCMEPGRDGVGDYTRRLSAALVGKGHSVAVMSLNDAYIQGVKTEEQTEGDASIQVLRVGEGYFPNKVYHRTKSWLDHNNPDWLSLQYVPFSFQKKGVPWRLGSRLDKLGRGKKWHIMFHELWVGMDKESSYKYKIWGKIQVEVAKRIIGSLQPKVMHTQAKLYQSQLERIGYETEVLPLFGNIPITRYTHENSNLRSYVTFVVFGQIQPGAPIESFVSEVADCGRRCKRKIQFIFIGRSGKELEKWTAVCAREDIDIRVMGEQTAREISVVLSKSDWGISTTPYCQIEKSGSVAAMLEHGMPVYCVARPWSPIDVPFPDCPMGIRVYEPGKLDVTPITLKNQKEHQLGKITDMFLASLSFKNMQAKETYSLMVP